MDPKLQIGDVVIVGAKVDGRFKPNPFKSTVKQVFVNPSTSQTEVILDWGAFGTSRVFMHDHNNTWVKAENFN